MKNPLVSIIMPVYNSERYVGEAIRSVIDQKYENWELLIVNDGSTDDSEGVILSYEDNRIQYFSKENGGVSSARNLALGVCKGAFMIFFDADDIMPEEAVSARMAIFDQDDTLDFVDGKVKYVSNELEVLDHEYIPDFQGNPLSLLFRLDRRCLFGNTWMVRRRAGITYRFNESLTHAEDLFFYLSICNQCETKYTFTNHEVLRYRQHPTSAMKNLKGLENGYYKLLQTIQSDISHTRGQFHHLKLRVIRIMFLSHLIDGKDLSSAFRVVFKFSWI
ncbi:glycosyltransferase family 2 protein [Marinoscillum pacificum]|uniref:glycosyltransferase family 2 protein n=1 Tax=Marinoscillum pacificum TaxID=392723 RepID=UPI002158403A|nr:glycosyltransferase family 2 protein [Marinoscillum pacificum]